MMHPNQSGSASGEAPLSRETLSSLIDGELGAADSAKLLGRLGADDAARREWLLLHLAGDALRSSDVASLQSDRFLARMSAALESEPTILAPRARLGRARLVRRFVLPGVAVAAAAAMLAVIAVPQLRGDEPAATQVAQSTPPVATMPVRAETNEVRRLAELEAYLAAHQELAGGSMMPRTAPYLRASAPTQR